MKKQLVAISIFLLTLVVYLVFAKKEYEALHYFLPLANSFWRGSFSVECTNSLNELVKVGESCFVVYPPMPAIALMPVVFLFGQKISQVYPQIIFSALGSAVFFLFLCKLTKTREAILLTLFLVFGTNFFMISMLGRSWYFAHICAVLFSALSLYFASSRKPFLSGLFLAFAGLSRLPVFLAFPAMLYILKPKKKELLQFVFPYIGGVLLLLAYNFVRFGNVFETGYSLIPGVLEESWYKDGIFSLSYIPRNLEAIFLFMPKFSSNFPYFLPQPMGMAMWLTSPALILLLTVLKDKTSRVMILTSLLVLVPSLVHGTVGFSQHGYRFSLDVILFLIIAMIPSLKDRLNLSYVLIAISILINLYTVLLFANRIFNI